jgi:hypothetical protein
MKLPIVFAIVLAGVSFVPALAQENASIATDPKDLIYVPRATGTSQFSFNVTGPADLKTITGTGVFHDNQVQNDFVTKLQFDPSAKLLAVQIQTSKQPAPGVYRIQLRDNSKAVRYTLPLTVKHPFTQIDPRNLKIKPGQMLQLSQPTAALPVPNTPTKRQSNIPKVTLNMPFQLDDFYPESVGLAGSTLVVEGKGLQDTADIYFAGAKLSRISSTDKINVYQFPDSKQTQTGDLAVDLGRAKLSLKSGYQIVPAGSLPPVETELVAPGSLVNIPHAKNFYAARVKNVPASFIRDPGTVQGAANRSFGIREGDIVDGVRHFYGNQFTIFFDAKSVNPSAPISIEFLEKEFHPTPQSPTSHTPPMSVKIPLPEPQPTQDYVVDNTSDLDRYFQWNNTSNWGVTTGTSDMAITGGQKIKVGHLDIDGDAAFRIASGPIGTHVIWTSAPLQMNEGWFVKEIHWSIQQHSPKGQPHKAYVRQLYDYTSNDPKFSHLDTEGRLSDLFLHGDDQKRWPARGSEPGINTALMCRFNEVLHTTQGDFPDTGKNAFTWFLRPMQLELNADSTLVNDHDVTLRLESVIFNGPPGKRWQDALHGPLPNEPFGINFLQGSAGETTLVLFQPD